MSHQIRRLSLGFASAFFMLALASGYWALIMREALLARPDNPRRILIERRVPRGPIFDRNGLPLAESVGAPGQLERYYTEPALAPVLGYVSPIYGLGGLEAAADAVLHGEAGRAETDLLWNDGLLNAPPPGQPLTLTLDLGLQRLSDAALGERVGAIVLLDPRTGDLLALASHPTFDPNHIEDQWPDLIANPHAPLLNRATQALYQPGGAVWPLILAGALQAGYGDVAAPFPNATASVAIGSQTVGCRVTTTVQTLTLAEALQAGCPQPFMLLGKRLGLAPLWRTFRAAGLFTAPAITLPTIAATESGTNTVELLAIGQGQLTLTPLHLALTTAAFANNGQMPGPRLLLSAPITATTVFSPEVAQTLAPLLAQGYAASALTSQAGRTLGWYTAYAPAESPQYVIAVLVEESSPNMAQAIGQAILKAALAR